MPSSYEDHSLHGRILSGSHLLLSIPRSRAMRFELEEMEREEKQVDGLHHQQLSSFYLYCTRANQRV